MTEQSLAAIVTGVNNEEALAMLNFLKRRLPARVIPINDQPYLTRYYIFNNRFFGLYLHYFHTGDGDGDRELHSHPWAFAIAYALRGGYREQKLTGSGIIERYINRHAQWFNFIGGNDYHRIASVMPGTHTLFFRGPKKGKWGFLTPDNEAQGGLTITFCEYKHD